MLRLTNLAALAVASLSCASLSACMMGDESDAISGTNDGAGAGQGEVFNPSPAGPDGLLPPGKIGIVLAHGFVGSEASFEAPIVAAITDQGHAVLRDNVPGVESVAVRAGVLGKQIDAFMAMTGVTKVHIIGHSMGGLDARYLVSKLGYAGKVASIMTVSTPHRGSPLADVGLGISSSSLVSQSDVFDALVELAGGPGADVAALNRALVDLSEKNAPIFNASVLDMPGVKYFSYAGFATPNGISNSNAAAACGGIAPPPDKLRGSLVLTAPIVSNGFDREPSDGVVNIESAKWGKFEACISADHLDENEVTPTPADGPSTNMVTFYGALAAKAAAL